MKVFASASIILVTLIFFSCDFQKPVPYSNYDNDCDLNPSYDYSNLEEDLNLCFLNSKLDRPMTTKYLAGYHFEKQGTYGYDVKSFNNLYLLKLLSNDEKRELKALRIEVFNNVSVKKEYPLDIDFSLFPNLEFLDISSNEFISLPASIKHLQKLNFLKISCSALKEYPAEIGLLNHLEHLILDYNDELLNFPTFISNLKELKHLQLERFHKIENLDIDLSSFPLLEKLVLNDNGGKDKNLNFINLNKLKYLSVDHFTSDVYKLISLEVLSFGYTHLKNEDLEGIENLYNLKELIIYRFLDSTFSAKLHQIPHLEYFTFGSTSLPIFDENLKKLNNLKYLYINTEQNTEYIPSFITSLENLAYLAFLGREQLRFSEDILQLPKLKYLVIKCKTINKIDTQLLRSRNIKYTIEY